MHTPPSKRKMTAAKCGVALGVSEEPDNHRSSARPRAQRSTATSRLATTLGSSLGVTVRVIS